MPEVPEAWPGAGENSDSVGEKMQRGTVDAGLWKQIPRRDSGDDAEGLLVPCLRNKLGEDGSNLFITPVSLPSFLSSGFLKSDI